MKKILIINTVLFGMSGISSVIMNYLTNVNKNNMKITVIVNKKIEKVYEDYLNKNGIRIVVLKRNYRIIRYIYKLYKIMKKEKFDVVHIHGNSSTMAFETIPAYLNKIPNRIVHSHSISCEHKIANKILWPILKRTYTLGVACSEEAGKWLFKKKSGFVILNNAINLEKYKFCNDVRDEIRENLKMKNSYVIGHIGYFNDGKNHEKLFEIVNYLKSKIDVQLLCIAGNSEVPDNIKEMIKKYDLEDNIKILLRRNDVNKLLQAMDYFVFPSKFEGLGLAIIEAQATGLLCLASDKVPKEAAICSELVSYCDLLSNGDVWASKILSIDKKIKFKSRKDRSDIAMIKLKEAGYDMVTESEKLRQIYMK